MKYVKTKLADAGFNKEQDGSGLNPTHNLGSKGDGDKPARACSLLMMSIIEGGLRLEGQTIGVLVILPNGDYYWGKFLGDKVYLTLNMDQIGGLLKYLPVTLEKDRDVDD